MASKRKDGFFVLLFKAVFEIIHYLFKGIYYLIKTLVRMFSISKSKLRNVKTNVSRPRVDPEVVDFSEVKRITGNLGVFSKKMLLGKSTIGLILGARGTGKSAIGLRILENLHGTGRRVCAIGFRMESLPRWINVYDSIDNVGNNSIVLVDEGGITFSSRNAMSEMNKMLSNMLLVARHNDLSLIFISQNSSNIEINTLRQADYLLLKPCSLLQKDFERKKIKEIYDTVSDDFTELNREGLTYIYSDQYRGFVTNSLPGFWSDDVSKAFRK